MEPSPQEFDINPYQPPSEEGISSAPSGPPVLKDLRLRGWLALGAISLQCAAGFLPLFIPFTSMVMLNRFLVVSVVALSLSGILFLRWVHGVAANTLRINPRSGISTGWSVGAYFVPFVNWVVPCVHMRAFIRECHPQGPPAGMLGLAVVWWVSFIFRGFGGPILRGSDQSLLGNVIIVGGTLLSWATVCFLVTRISRRHFEFRWSDVPAARRPQMLANMTRTQVNLGPRPSGVAEGAPMPPRRAAVKPISIEEQNRLLSEMEREEKSAAADSNGSA